MDREKLDEQKAVGYDSFVELAKRCVGDRHFAAAVEHVRKAISLDPGRPEGFNLLGALTEIQHNVLEAQKYYRAALDLDPTYKPAKDNLDRSTRWQRGGNIVLEQAAGDEEKKTGDG
jgi:Flp pilus assembly protein TadD